MAQVQIINNETGEAEESFDVSGESDRQIERLIRGIEINLDHTRYYVDRDDVEGAA